MPTPGRRRVRAVMPQEGLMLPLVFAVVLAAGCGLAFWKGHRSERATAGVLLAAAIGSPLVASGFTTPEIGVLVIDASLFGFLLALAMVSDRFWPIWAAGFQIVGTLIHVARLIDNDIWPYVYATAEAFWAYPVLAALGLGTWLEARFRDS